MSDRTKEEIIENINHIVNNHIQPSEEMHEALLSYKTSTWKQDLLQCL